MVRLMMVFAILYQSFLIYILYLMKILKRLINLGENPKYIYNFGALGSENAREIINKKKYNFSLNKNFKNDLITITYHSQTNKKFSDDLKIMKNIFKLIKTNTKYKYIFTNSNSDPGGIKLMSEINKFCKKF